MLNIVGKLSTLAVTANPWTDTAVINIATTVPRIKNICEIGLRTFVVCLSSCTYLNKHGFVRALMSSAMREQAVVMVVWGFRCRNSWLRVFPLALTAGSHESDDIHMT